MAEIIRKESLTAFERLRFASFDTPVSDKSSPPSPRPAFPDDDFSPEETEGEEAPSSLGEDVTTVPTPALADEETRQLVYEEARQQGYEEGKAQALREIEEEHQKLLEAQRQEHAEQLGLLLGNAANALQELEQEVASQLLDLALEVSAQITRHALEVRRDLLLPVIREAISLLPLHHGHLVCQLNPADKAALSAESLDHLQQHGVQLMGNPDISPGGCLIKAGASEVDAQIETRWRRALDALGAPPHEWLQKG